MTNYDWANGLAIQSAVLIAAALVVAIATDAAKSNVTARRTARVGWILFIVAIIGAIASAWIAAAGGLL